MNLRRGFSRRPPRIDVLVSPKADVDLPGPATAWKQGSNRYSITACSGAADCLRSVALLEPIMIVSGIAHSVKIITIW